MIHVEPETHFPLFPLPHPKFRKLLSLSRVETEDFLGHYQVPLALIETADLDRETALLETIRRNRH